MCAGFRALVCGTCGNTNGFRYTGRETYQCPICGSENVLEMENQGAGRNLEVLFERGYNHLRGMSPDPDNARICFSTMINQAPENYKGWLGCFVCNIFCPRISRIQGCEEHVSALAPDQVRKMMGDFTFYSQWDINELKEIIRDKNRQKAELERKLAKASNKVNETNCSLKEAEKNLEIFQSIGIKRIRTSVEAKYEKDREAKISKCKQELEWSKERVKKARRSYREYRNRVLVKKIGSFFAGVGYGLLVSVVFLIIAAIVQKDVSNTVVGISYILFFLVCTLSWIDDVLDRRKKRKEFGTLEYEEQQAKGMMIGAEDDMDKHIDYLNNAKEAVCEAYVVRDQKQAEAAENAALASWVDKCRHDFESAIQERHQYEVELELIKTKIEELETKKKQISQSPTFQYYLNVLKTVVERNF